MAEFAAGLAQRAVDRGLVASDCVPLTYAGGFLHDLAKTYCIHHGGSHAQIGASWVLQKTGNPLLAQMVLYHVEWAHSLPDNLCHPVFFVNYADKRILHDSCVSLDVRYTDLLKRYTVSERARQVIQRGHVLGVQIENALAAQLEWPIHACSLVDGRLVF